jgi:hypothetical protein
MCICLGTPPGGSAQTRPVRFRCGAIDLRDPVKIWFDLKASPGADRDRQNPRLMWSRRKRRSSGGNNALSGIVYSAVKTAGHDGSAGVIDDGRSSARRVHRTA